MHKYRLIAKKGEGTFSEVLKAQSIKNGKYLAIKCMKNHFTSIEQVNNLREIQALRRLSPNPHIIKLYEVLYDQPTGRLALVFELMDCNIYELIRGRRHYLPESRVKMYMYQLIKAMDHMHRNGIFHRDIKPENILIMDDLLKLADFGSCRGIYSKQPYTEYISTRWYRAPECLLTDGYYGYKMDMWGVGCVMFEILALYPLFAGKNEMDQINRIHKVMGTPPSEVLAKFKRYSSHIDFNFPPKQGTGIASMLAHVSSDAVDIITKLLAYDPEDRISARQALRHPWFHEIRAADKRNSGNSSTARSGTSRTNTSRVPRGPGAAGEASDAGATGGSSEAPKDAAGTGNAGKPGATVASDPGLPTIAKGSSTKRSHAPSLAGTSKSHASSTHRSHHGHHGHHGHGHRHGKSSTGSNLFSHSHRGPAAAAAAAGAGDASLPPIGKPLYASSVKMGGSRHHKKTTGRKPGGRAPDYYKGGSTAASKTSKYYGRKAGGGRAPGLAATSGSKAGAGAGAGQSGANPNKYLSPYSQKFIKTQRGAP